MNEPPFSPCLFLENSVCRLLSLQIGAADASLEAGLFYLLSLHHLSLRLDLKLSKSETARGNEQLAAPLELRSYGYRKAYCANKIRNVGVDQF